MTYSSYQHRILVWGTRTKKGRRRRNITREKKVKQVQTIPYRGLGERRRTISRARQRAARP